MLRRIAVPLLLVTASVCVFFAGLELALRLIDHPRTEAKILCLDAIMGNVYCPGLDEQLDNMYGATIRVNTNSLGMADREYASRKPPGALRIALLGDSLTASLYMPVNGKFKALWEAALSQRLARPVEILNFAVDGMGTWEELQMFHLRARRFEPDAVILGFFWGNDTWNNLASLSKGRPNPLLGQYPEPSWLRRMAVAHRSTIRWLWNNSAAFQFLDILKTRIQTKRSYERAQEAAARASARPAEPEYDPGFAWESEGWDLTRSLILKLKTEAEAAGARLLVLQLPMLSQLGLPKPLPYRELRGFLARNGIGNADAFDALERLGPDQRRGLYIADKVHLTAEGHRLIAEATLADVERFLREGLKR